jgi:hypothetical protein
MTFSFLSVQGPSALALATAFGLVVLTAATASGQQDLHDDDWSFNFFNDANPAVREFRVQEMSGAMSHNWLDSPMTSGTGLTLEFYDPLDKRCEMLTRVVFDNGQTLDGIVNYCGTAIVRVTNQGMFYE